MSILELLGYPSIKYSRPERFDRFEPSAVRRRVERELERVRAIEDRRFALSPANQLHMKIINDFLAESQKAELDVRRAKERMKVAPSQRNFADHKAAVSRLFNLHQRVERLRKQGATVVRSTAAKASAGDRRQFNFSSSPTAVNARTVFGTEAFVKFVPVTARAAAAHFLSPAMVIPCIQREVRREVMFASRKAGRGYRVPHHRGPHSDIGC